MIRQRERWRETTLGEVIELFDHKRVPLSTKQRNARIGPYPYYGASGIIDHIDDYLFDGRYILVSEDGANLVSRNTPVAFLATGKFWVNNHAHVIRGVEGVVDDYFLVNYIESLDISGYVTGTAQPKLSQANLKEIRISLPSVSTQRRIARILSAYDDLIENNTRRIAILEKMAQAIYSEWFVHFRFPGHEDVEMVESELGPIPAGWEVVPLSTIASRVRGNVKPADHPQETFAHYSFSAFDSGRQPALEKGSEIRSAKYIVQPRTVLIAKLNPRIPRVWMPYPPPEYRSICSTEFVVLDPKEVSVTFLFGLLSSDTFLARVKSRAGGTSTSHQRVKIRDLMSMPVMLPSSLTIEAFTDVVEPMHRLMERLRQKNRTLRQTRDLLLPRLISGEINVEALDPEPLEAVV